MIIQERKNEEEERLTKINRYIIKLFLLLYFTFLYLIGEEYEELEELDKKYEEDKKCEEYNILLSNNEEYNLLLSIKRFNQFN